MGSTSWELDDMEPPSLKEMAAWLLFLAATFSILFLNNAILARRQPFVVQVDNLLVSNFSVRAGSQVVDGVWDADVSFGNRNKAALLQIPAFASHVYKGRDVLACAAVDAVELSPGTKRTVRIRHDAEGCGKQRGVYVKEEVARELSAEWETGTVHFALGMDVVVKTSFLRERLRTWGQGARGTATCPNLGVAFLTGDGEGHLISLNVTCVESFT